jgi:hypothetical protein
VLQRPLKFAGKRVVPCSWQNRRRAGPLFLATDNRVTPPPAWTHPPTAIATASAITGHVISVNGGRTIV